MDGLVPASKTKRLVAALTDMVNIPVVLGILIGTVLLTASDAVRSTVLVFVNIAWLVFRDAVFSPGRIFKVRRIINITCPVIALIIAIVAVISNPGAIRFLVILTPYLIISVISFLLDKGGNLVVVSLNGTKVTWLQGLIRNIFLVVPFALVTGYLCEVARLLLNKWLLWRRIVYVLCVVAALALLPATIPGGLLAILGDVLALTSAVLFLLVDKEPIASGRLADLWSKTQVVEA